MRRRQLLAAAVLALLGATTFVVLRPRGGGTRGAVAPSDGSSISRRLLFAAAVLALLSATVFVALRPGDNGATVAVAPSTATATVTATPASPQSSAAPLLSPTPFPQTPEFAGIDITRLVVPELGIDAPIVTRGVDESGTMEVPDTPTDVAWYTFSALPGEGSNVVLAGHLDYVNYGAAVFYRIKDAVEGDEVRLDLVDGTTAVYRVTSVTSYLDATAPVAEIVGPTEGDQVTLITCGGSFDPLAREYDQRVVVRAERVETVATAP